MSNPLEVHYIKKILGQKVLEHPRRRSVSFDQCQLGQRTTTGESVKKPTELVASDDDLIYYFKGPKVWYVSEEV